MNIDSNKLQRLLRQHVKFHLIDVRSPQEFQNGHIEGASNIPADVFLKKIGATISQKDAAIVIYDGRGENTAKLVSGAERLGYLNIVDLDGGYAAFLKGS